MVRVVDNTDSSRFDSGTEAPINYVVLDAETTTYNKGHRFDPRNKVISYAYKSSGDVNCNFNYHTDPGFSNKPTGMGFLVGFNIKFDAHWLYPDGCVEKIWDCQIAEHVLTGQKAPFISLNECLEKYGLEVKKDVVSELWDAGVQTDELPLPLLEEYNCWDVIQTEKLFLLQWELMDEEQRNLVFLLGEDLKVLVHIEASGMVVDRVAATSYLEQCKVDVKSIESKLSNRLPEIQHGSFNWDSGDALSCFLYGGTLKFDWFTSVPSVYKSGAKKGEEYEKRSWFVEDVTFPGYFKPLEGTEVAKTKGVPDAPVRYYQTDVPTLAALKSGGKEGKEIVALLNERGAKQKVVEMLESIFKLFDTYRWENNVMHPTYNQNVAITGRLSSSKPNGQNQPPEIDQFIVSRYDM